MTGLNPMLITPPLEALFRAERPALCGGCMQPFVWHTGVDGALCARCAEPETDVSPAAALSPVALRAGETFVVLKARCVDAITQTSLGPVPRLFVGDGSIVHGSTTPCGAGDIVDARVGQAAWAAAVLDPLAGLSVGSWRFGLEGACVYAYS